jgi:acetyl-CoA carboxylase biotin carboxylase subunit
MEANTRLQVEHPVTEEVTGIDIVKLQILVAAGEEIPFSQEDVEFKGHAIEFRINSEDPSNNFLPVAGKIEKLTLPGGPGVRVDTHIYPGYKIPPYYDSLLAKLVVWGRTREEAISRGERALEEFVVEGLPTTIPFHKKVLGNAFFKKGEVYTNFVSRRLNLS